MNNISAATQGSSAFSIAEVAKAAGVTSRTLRHYDHIGLLTPAYTAANGYRFYTQAELVRLQRILLLRQLGLGLETIGDVLDSKRDQELALRTHVEDLLRQRENLDRQISALHHTINSLSTGEAMNLDAAFEGFNEQYKDEVTARWGADAYKKSNDWWRSKSVEERSDFMALVKGLNEDWAAVGESGAAPDSEAAQELAARHVRWLRSVPGTPAATGDPLQLKMYVLGLAEMYVADERFAKNYQGHAPLVRDALQIFMENLPEAEEN